MSLGKKNKRTLLLSHEGASKFQNCLETFQAFSCVYRRNFEEETVGLCCEGFNFANSVIEERNIERVGL